LPILNQQSKINNLKSPISPFVPPSFLSNNEPFPIWNTECRITKFRIPDPNCPITFYFSLRKNESPIRTPPQTQTRIVYF
jgi:hypothetical protein